MSDKHVYVTRSSLPPLEEVLPWLQKIWGSGTLTNCGPLHQELEEALANYLGVRHLSLFNNGTTALMVALKALDLTGEIITTPYTFVATTHAILWNDLTPVFADVDPRTGNLDPRSVEEAITERTSAILPVHCYGTLCETEKFTELAKRYKLALIYDAAHTFGVNRSNGSHLEEGDLSILSFHATKVFNTFEGGAVVSLNAEMKTRVDRYRNFGFAAETQIVHPGLNGKLSEIHAAVGLAQLPHVDACIAKRQQLAQRYQQRFASIAGLRLLPPQQNTKPNHAYFPIFVEESFPLKRDELAARLAAEKIMARRYFFPLTTELESVKTVVGTNTGLPHAMSLSNSVLCLPISAEYSIELVDKVADIIENIASRG